MERKVLAGLMAVFILISFVSNSIADESGIRRQLNYGSPSSFAEFHGFMDLLYFDFEGDGKDDGQRIVDMHNFYLSAKSSVRENIFVYGEIEYEQGGDEIKFEQGYIDWGVNPEVNLKIGQFFTPFGIDKTNSVLPPLNKLVSKPQIIDELSYGDWPDVGLWTYGYRDIKPFSLSYDLAIIKGPAGLLKSGLKNKENNQNKMFMGRLIFNPLYSDDYIMDIGLSYASGKYDDASAKDLALYGLYGRFITEELDLRGEYMKRRGDDERVVDKEAVVGDNTDDTVTSKITTTDVEAEASGYYIQIAYKVIRDQKNINFLEPVLRYDVSDINGANNRYKRLTLGLGYSPYQHLQFRAEYQNTNESNKGLDNNGYMLKAVADF